MDEKKEQRLLNRLFELRSVIGVLFAVYGVVCVVWGIGFTSQRELDKAAGINVNLWAGIAMLVFAAAFITWAVLGAEPQKATGAAPAEEDAAP